MHLIVTRQKGHPIAGIRDISGANLGNKGAVFANYKRLDSVTNPLAPDEKVTEHPGFMLIIFLCSMSYYCFIKDGEAANKFRTS